MSSSLAGRGIVGALLRTNLLRDGTDGRPGSMGSQRVAGASVASSASFRGPVRRSYTEASVLRQLAAATERSGSVNGNCVNFSASAKVETVTSGPTGGPAPNAGGAPGGRFPGFWT